MDQVQLADRNYISAKRGAEITGYTQDYIGQLCRSAKIPCRRIGNNWYISENDLSNYRSGKAAKNQPINTSSTVDSSFSEGGITFISSKIASDITGYTQDYIGQLARNGKIKSCQIGRQWYVAQNELIWHQENTSAYTVGFNEKGPQEAKIGDVIDLRYKETPKIMYHDDKRPLRPELKKPHDRPVLREVIEDRGPAQDVKHLERPKVVAQHAAVALQKSQSVLPGVVFKALSAGALVVFLLFVSASISSIEGHSSYSRVGERIVFDGRRISFTEGLLTLMANTGRYAAAAGDALSSALEKVEEVVR